MVRLVITDFTSKEENESFYISDEFDVSQNMFTYDSFKKHSVYLSKYDTSDQVYSLNLLSKKHLSNNQLLIHVSDEEFYILFNHKTVYTAKINANFITDDMMKSILITRHIAMLSSGGEIENIYYVINSKFHSAVENILMQNTKNEKNEVIAHSLGNVDDLIQGLNELDDVKSYISKASFLGVMIIVLSWTMFFGLGLATDKLLYKHSLKNLEREIKIEKRLAKRQGIILRNTQKKYDLLTGCISKDEVIK